MVKTKEDQQGDRYKAKWKSININKMVYEKLKIIKEIVNHESTIPMISYSTIISDALTLYSDKLK